MTRRIAFVVLAAALALPVHAATPVAETGGAEFKSMAASKAVVAARMRLDGSAAAHRIALVSPTAIERAKLFALNRNGGSAFAAPGYPQFIGFGRDVAAEKRRIDFDSLAWTTLDGGARVARIEVASADAKGVRVALRLASSLPGVELRFAAPGASEAAYSVNADDVAKATAQFGEFWTPYVDGDRAAIEIEAKSGAPVAGAVLEIPLVSHLVVGVAASRAERAKTLSDIGDSGSCNIDVACPVVPQDQITFNAANSTGELLFNVPSGGAALCTGTLVNDTTTSFTPYLFSANHCFQSAYEAATLQVWWFFDATGCNNQTPGNYVVQNSGAFLLGRSQDADWALLRLNAFPPLGTYYSGWSATELDAGSTVEIFHHPSGDLKKWSRGTSSAPQHVFFGTAGGGPGLFYPVVWSNGTTEGGSSGGALKTFPLGANGLIRGGLLGGDALCTNPSGTDYFSRFRAMYPLTRQYITPDQVPPGYVVVVEFYNPTLNHYFMTASPIEIGILDGGNPPGWQRTGFTFLAYDNAGPGRNPVCRYYQSANNSHFYSADPFQCAAVAVSFPDWTFESSNVFYIGLPNTTTGACAGDTRPVYRFYHPSVVNHRFPAEQTVATDLSTTPGWVAEGYGFGPLYPSMCSPNGEVPPI